MQGDSRPQRDWSPALAHTITKPVIAVVMGVSGSGKTTVAALLAAALGCQFQEGDDLHPAANVEKMHAAARRLRMQTGCLGCEKSPRKSMVGARVANTAC